MGDQQNTPFEILESDVQHAKPGLDFGEERPQVGEGEHRFPRRSEEKDIPRASLADRIRSARQGG